MVGQPLPIHCQINVGTADKVVAPGKIGDIAKAAAQNVRASIKKVLNNIGAPYVGYEMYVDYIQAHGGVEGDSASVAKWDLFHHFFSKKALRERAALRNRSCLVTLPAGVGTPVWTQTPPHCLR